VLIVMGLVYNTKEASKPASYQDLLNPKYKGRVGIPTYGWVGNSWLQVLNKTLGGNEDNVDPGIKFLAQLVKKNEAVIIENTDAAMKAFTREEIVIMPTRRAARCECNRGICPGRPSECRWPDRRHWR
jgi:putative spermidine/putrescine transport system substrate-binding protein